MKASEELHQLIHSMNMSEKRYFKIHSSLHTIGKTNNYIRLFDFIESQEKYDEQEVKQKFKGETFIRHLPSEKHYLYQQILDALNAYNQEKTFLSRYANTLVSIEILYNKGLYKHCHKLILKSKAEAYSLEKFAILQLLIHWETILFIRDEDEKNLSKSLQEEGRLLEAMQIQAVLMEYAFQIQIQIDKGNIPSDFADVWEKKLRARFPPRKEVNSFWATYYYYSGIGLLSSLKKDLLGRYDCYKQIKKLMDEAPQFIRDLPAIYHLNNNNLVNAMFYLSKLKEAETLIMEQCEMMQSSVSKNPGLSTRVYLNTCESQLFLFYRTKRYQEGCSLNRRIETELKKIGTNPGPIVFDLYFMMGAMELVSGNHKASTRWLNKILNSEYQSKVRKELQINTRLLYLIILLDENDVLFENRLNTYKKFIAQENGLLLHSKILDVLQVFGEEGLSAKNRPLLKKKCAEIRNETEKLNQEAINKQFDFAEWIEEKLRVS